MVIVEPLLILIESKSHNYIDLMYFRINRIMPSKGITNYLVKHESVDILYAVFGSLLGRKSWRKLKNFPLSCCLVGKIKIRKILGKIVEKIRHIFLLYFLSTCGQKRREKNSKQYHFTYFPPNSYNLSVFPHGYNRNYK